MILAVVHLHPPLDCALGDFTGLLLDTVRARHPKGGGGFQTRDRICLRYGPSGKVAIRGVLSVLMVTSRSSASRKRRTFHPTATATHGTRGHRGEEGRKGRWGEEDAVTGRAGPHSEEEASSGEGADNGPGEESTEGSR